MGNFEERVKQRAEAAARMTALAFGDPVTNVCAGEKNPHRHSFVVSHGKTWVECTDKKGEFWETGIEVIYPGHLDSETCERLFAPIWQAKYGETAADQIKEGPA